MLSEFNLRVEHLAQIQPREHLLHETDCGYYNDTIFMVVWNIVTMIFIIIINLGYSHGREKQLTNIRLRIRACEWTTWESEGSAFLELMFRHKETSSHCFQPSV